MSETLTIIAQLAGLVFVVGSMLAMGLSLAVAQIVQPLKNVRLVVLALVANFIVAPALVYGITAVIPVSEGQRIGLILLGTAAGAPFLPKLAQAAKGDIAFAVGLMVLLMVVTVIFLPLVLPLLLTGVEVNPLDIASSLIITMLIPLGIGLFIKARYPEMAQQLQPTFAQASNTSLLMMMGILLTLNVRNILSTIGTGTIIAGSIFLIVSFIVGYLLGGSDADTKSVMGLGTGQRNISAALVVAGQNFTDPDVLITLIVIAIIGLIILMPLGGELGKRKETTAVAG